jgi:anti-sigma regulatory factor (Ser/Thr protein kinase)/ActR/RegA family two-component response regulator
MNTTARRVLAIRPDPPLTAMLAKVLDLTQHEIECCTGNVEAIQRMRWRAIDVVITDPSTTIEEDLALATELRNVRPAVRIIALALYVTQTALIEAIRSHVFACFTPPFDYGEITSMVSDALKVDGWSDGIQVVSGSPHWLTLRVACRLVTAERLVRFMTELQPAAPDADRDLLIAAFREMLLNAMEYGAGFDPEKVVEVTAARTARAIVYHFKDPGNGFDRNDLAHATESASPDMVLASAIRRAEIGLRPGGFGMLIAHQVADELVYNERGNEVLLIKHIDQPSA